jgi:hypothetical protein
MRMPLTPTTQQCLAGWHGRCGARAAWRACTVSSPEPGAPLRAASPETCHPRVTSCGSCTRASRKWVWTCPVFVMAQAFLYVLAGEGDLADIHQSIVLGCANHICDLKQDLKRSEVTFYYVAINHNRCSNHNSFSSAGSLRTVTVCQGGYCHGLTHTHTQRHR